MLAPYPNEIYTTFAFLGFLLSVVTLRWHLIAWNTGTCIYMFWTALNCLVGFINSIVWKGTAMDLAPVWCDISTRITVSFGVAIPAALLCINRRLYNIASCSAAQITRSDKRRAVLQDLAIGFGIPIAQMFSYHISQGHRYDIFEDIGCMPIVYNTPMAYFTNHLWPIVVGLISAVYCVLAIRAFRQRQQMFNAIQSKNKFFTANRYLRLQGMAVTDLLISVPLSTYALIFNATDNPMYPWISWADTHANFWRVALWPSPIWHLDTSLVVAFEIQRWMPIVCAVIYFGFFGFAQEARRNYRSAVESVGRVTGLEKLLPTLTNGSSRSSPSASLPMSQPTIRSFGTNPSTLPTLVSTGSFSSVHKVGDLDTKEPYSPTGSCASSIMEHERDRPIPALPETPVSPSIFEDDDDDEKPKPRRGADMV